MRTDAQIIERTMDQQLANHLDPPRGVVFLDEDPDDLLLTDEHQLSERALEALRPPLPEPWRPPEGYRVPGSGLLQRAEGGQP